MITGTLRNQIDRLWTEFWTGGITNPLTVIEQISFLMFARLLDIAETRAEKRATRPSKFHLGAVRQERAASALEHFKNLPAEEMLEDRAGRGLPALPRPERRGLDVRRVHEGRAADDRRSRACWSRR